MHKKAIKFYFEYLLPVNLKFGMYSQFTAIDL